MPGSSVAAPFDLLLLDGRVYARPEAPPYQALGVRAGRVAALGASEALRAQMGPGTKVVPLAGRAVLPGFVDAHVHLLWWALGLERVQLDGLGRLDDALAAVAAQVSRTRPGAWVQGQGWNKNLWGGFPTRQDLDRVAPAQPVALWSKDGHALWANSEALRRAGIDASTPDPPGGQLLRDARGEPTGVLLEDAKALLERVIEPPDAAACEAALRRGLPLALGMGLTGAHDLGCPGVPHPTLMAAYQALERAGALPLRVTLGIPLTRLPQAVEVGLRSGFGSPTLRIGPVKIFTDGALGPQTAWLLEPYEGSASRGIPTIEREALVEAVRLAEENGLGVAMHAIGDQAVRLALDAVEVARASVTPAPGTPPARIEHAQLVDPADVPRFAQLGVVASMQPIHATSDMLIAERHWGPRRAGHAYAWRSLLDAGTPLAFGTDAPVERLEPLLSLFAAVTRQRESGEPPGGWHPEQRLTLAEAVRAYTHGSAIAAGLERELGDLAVGKRADFVVLDRDVLAAEAATLLETGVDLVGVEGRIVFQRGEPRTGGAAQ